MTNTRYVIMIECPLRGWIPVGCTYRSRNVARGWLSFVRAAWHGLPGKVMTIENARKLVKS